jgi:glutamate synthase domain-containing protein 3
MTNGRVIVLGLTGKNFAAGMSGGLAYVLDQEGTFESRCNKAMVTLQRLSDPFETKALKEIIHKHFELSESARAKEILGDWPRYEPLFWKVTPLPPATPPPAAANTTTMPDPVKPAPTPAAGEPAKA